MKVKKKVNNTTPNEEKIVALKKEIDTMEFQMHLMREEMTAKKNELLSLRIEPFKIGDYALALVPSGRTAKIQKCRLECDKGVLYLRPVTKDGNLSGRRFSYYPIKQSYQDYLKPVEE